MQSCSPISRWLASTSPVCFSSYAIVAAFLTYFCMYAFRKPFTAGEFGEFEVYQIGYKTILIAAQVAGYTVSKFIGIKVISEMPAGRRAASIIGLIGIAEVALLLFAVVPPPYNWPLLFINGLPLGMVFGLVLSFLEGRQVTEALSAGLCASFIVASGVVKSVGRALIVDFGVSEFWMPFLTGLIFVLPLLVGVGMLSQIPQPNAADVSHRSERVPMGRANRKALFRRHAFGLTGLVLIYVLLTVIRSFRDDFAVELWGELGHPEQPSVFAYSEIAVMMGVILINGSAVFVRSNRTAFFGSFGLMFGGFLLILGALIGHTSGILSPFVFMVLIGLGAYVPYVAFHTTVFERLLAVFRERGNIGYLMYLADAMGYMAYVGVMVVRNLLPTEVDFLPLFLTTTYWLSITAIGLTVALALHFARRIPVTISQASPVQTAPDAA